VDHDLKYSLPYASPNYSESNVCASWVLLVVRLVRDDRFVSSSVALIDDVNRADKSDNGILTPLKP
jgi:hypothetical protein